MLDCAKLLKGDHFHGKYERREDFNEAEGCEGRWNREEDRREEEVTSTCKIECERWGPLTKVGGPYLFPEPGISPVIPDPGMSPNPGSCTSPKLPGVSTSANPGQSTSPKNPGELTSPQIPGI